MTREARLEFCKICRNKKFDHRYGIVCALTERPAEFEGTCDHFAEDIELKLQLETKKIEHELLFQTASQGKRFINYLLDNVFLYIFSFFFGIILGVALLLVSPATLSLYSQSNLFIKYLLGLFIGIIYYALFEAATGRTPAKFITRTKVVDENGNKPGWNLILIRSLCRYIPFEAFSFLGSDSSGWHDRLSGTRVIDT